MFRTGFLIPHRLKIHCCNIRFVSSCRGYNVFQLTGRTCKTHSQLLISRNSRNIWTTQKLSSTSKTAPPKNKPSTDPAQNKSSPKTAQNEVKVPKSVGYWLLTCSGMVFVAVMLGGITRLTESGLSMVNWKLLGEKMPTNAEQWVSEFEKYKEFPEFKMKNREMTLEEFKWIWRMEYAHRMWARTLGVVYLIPATIFCLRKKFTPSLEKRVWIMGILIVAQVMAQPGSQHVTKLLEIKAGLFGWYMVKSGLENRFDGPNDVPRVSQYRLATHLTLAFVVYTMFLRAGLEQVLKPHNWYSFERTIAPFRRHTYWCKGAILCTAITGAFVAGLDAGLVYSSFPKMGDSFIPKDIMALTPKYKNLTENPTTVMFIHRILGIGTASLIFGLWIVGLKRPISPRAKMAVNALFGMACAQVALGIYTVLNYVPINLAVAHQTGSLILLSIVTWLITELKLIKKIIR